MVLKLLLAAILALGIGNVGQYFWGKWQARGYQKQIAELQQKNLEQEMIIKAKDKELQYSETKAKVKEKVVYVHREIDKVVESGDSSVMRRLFVEHGMLHGGGKASPPAGGGRGNPKPPAS